MSGKHNNNVAINADVNIPDGSRCRMDRSSRPVFGGRRTTYPSRNIRTFKIEYRLIGISTVF